jgi:hypothetical protein
MWDIFTVFSFCIHSYSCIMPLWWHEFTIENCCDVIKLCAKCVSVVVDYIAERYDVELNENGKICQYRSLTHSYKLTVGICKLNFCAHLECNSRITPFQVFTERKIFWKQGVEKIKHFFKCKVLTLRYKGSQNTTVL